LPVPFQDSSAYPSSCSGSSATSTPAIAPVISINGEDPAHITVGSSYADLGATITAPQADLNLGIHLFLNGSPVNIIQLDTSAATTDPSSVSALTTTATSTSIARSSCR
jgi:hypothetical protein